jgi:fused signal recognition particle receptor
MFKFLKEKIQGAVSSLTKKSEEDVIEEEKQPETPVKTKQEQPKQVVVKEKKKPQKATESVTEVQEEAPTPEKDVEEKKQPETPVETKQEQPEKKQPAKQETSPEESEKKGFFTKLSEKITTIQLSDEKFEDLFWDLEIGLLENNVAVEVIEKIKEDLREELTTGRTSRGNLQERIYRRLEETLTEILAIKSFDLLEDTNTHKPLVIAAIGVNGSGKTTSLAKLAHYFKENKKSVLLAAGDTFRAAAIQQLEEHAKNLDVPIIKQDYGADAAAVAFDAIQAAKARDIDVVLIDTAGRLHSNTNLMDELKKVIRVAKPHRTLFVGEATTGNDCVEQARKFSEHITVDGIILTKADVDEHGGAAISATYVTKTPILFLGTGQDYDDLQEFSPEIILERVLKE